MRVVSRTDIGKIRTENQDCVHIKALDNNSVVIVICDGIGGQAAGKEASEIASNAIFDRIVLSYRDDADENSIRNLLVSSINAANSIVYEKSITDDDKEGMGTTCVCGIIKRNMAYIANVGDSRAYLLTKDNCTQITVDHTYARMLFNNGEITEDEISIHPDRNLITRAVGVDNKIDVDYYETELSDDSIILMCTDGLSQYCSESDIHKLAFMNNIELSAENLVQFALEKGGKDNITVALASAIN